MKIIIATLIVASFFSDAFASPAVHRLPEIKYADLVTRDPETAQNLVNHFTQLGAAQITGIPRFGMTRKRALEDLADCLVEEKNAPSIMMADGSKRISTGAASHNGVADKMENKCGDTAIKLRSSIDAVVHQLLVSLDLVKSSQSNQQPQLIMQPSYDSFAELVSHGEHLEHLHAYYSPDSSDKAQASSTATLDYHVDAGMIIAMTTGFYSNAEPSAQSGLYMKLSDGSRVKAEMEEDALIVMMGDGAAKWLSPVFGQPFRALPHALVADLPVGSAASRSWYGKMYLPPAEAVIPETQGMTFKQYHQVESKKSSMLNQVTQQTDQSLLQQLLPAACGGEVGRRYLLTVSESCSSNQIWCWARCMDVGELPCGSDAICWDTSKDILADPNQHCGKNCVPTCHAEPTTAPTTLSTSNNQGEGSVSSMSNSNNYCLGKGTSMSMEGFFSMVSNTPDNIECINLWFTEWTLDSPTKYSIGCIGVFIMCVIIQYLAKMRMESNTKTKDRTKRMLINCLTYGVNVALGYFAMLAAMTYSVEIFSMICAGLTVGYALFHATSASDTMPSTDPCCPEHTEECDFTSKVNDAAQDDKDKQRQISARDVSVAFDTSGDAKDDDEDYGNCCAGTGAEESNDMVHKGGKFV